VWPTGLGGAKTCFSGVLFAKDRIGLLGIVGLKPACQRQQRVATEPKRDMSPVQCPGLAALFAVLVSAMGGRRLQKKQVR
jgi:hypothetical protein